MTAHNKFLLENDDTIKFHLNRANILMEDDESDDDSSDDSSNDDESDDESSDDENTTHFDIKTKILLRQIKDTIDISIELSSYMTSIYGREFIQQKRQILKIRELFKIFINNYSEYDDDDKSKILFKFRKVVSNNLKRIQKIIKE